MISYENLQVKIKGKRGWFYIKPDDLIGAELKDLKVVKKRTRTWLE